MEQATLSMNRASDILTALGQLGVAQEAGVSTDQLDALAQRVHSAMRSFQALQQAA